MIKYFVKHPTAANLIMLTLLILGCLQLSSIQRETMPKFTPSIVEITIPYPGASAYEIEESICQRVEDAIDGISDVKEVVSESIEGLARINVEMMEKGDFPRFLDDVITEVEAISEFPDLAEKPVIVEKDRTDLVMSVLVSGEMDAVSLKAHCEILKDRLKAFGLSLIEVVGFPDHQLRVELSAEALLMHGLSAKEVGDIISRQNIDLPVGTIETAERDLLLRFKEEKVTPFDLLSLVVISKANGSEILLSDIANVVDLFESPEEKVERKGVRSGVLQIKKTTKQDTIRIAEKVRDFVKIEQQRNPKVTLEIIQDSSTILVDRLNMLIRNGWQGLFLVFLTLWAFFNIRLSFWVAMGLPVSFLGSLFFFTLHRLNDKYVYYGWSAIGHRLDYG